MKRIIWPLFAVLIFFSSVTCTQNQLARRYGGTSVTTLPDCEKFVNATWKEDDLWYVTRSFKTDEQPEVYKFQESSSFGVWEGTMIIKETCSKTVTK